MTKTNKNAVRNGERGGATVKFLAVVTAIFLIGYGAFNYITVWYQCAQFQDAMRESIERAAVTNEVNYTNPEKIKQFLRRKADENSVPADAVIKIDKTQAGITAQANFTRDVSILPFNAYNYKYQFNHMQTPPGFLTKSSAAIQ